MRLPTTPPLPLPAHLWLLLVVCSRPTLAILSLKASLLLLLSLPLLLPWRCEHIPPRQHHQQGACHVRRMPVCCVIHDVRLNCRHQGLQQRFKVLQGCGCVCAAASAVVSSGGGCSSRVVGFSGGCMDPCQHLFGHVGPKGAGEGGKEQR